MKQRSSGLPVVKADQAIRRLQIAMDDPFVRRVLHRMTHVREQAEPFFQWQAGAVAVFRERDAFDVFHHEVGTALIGHAAVENLRNVRMIHHGQGLPFDFASGLAGG